MRNVQRWSEVAVILLVFFVICGEPPPHVNEPHYLCRHKHFWNPTWCDGDLFLESTEAHLTFVLAFGWLTRYLSLTATAWIGRMICWLLLAWSWQRLSWRLMPRPFCSVLSAALFILFIQHGHFSGEWIVGGVESKCVAYAFVVAGLGALLENRWNQLWICLGAATAFHALVGGWSTVVCAAIWLLVGRRAAALHSMSPGLAVGAALSLAGVVPAIVLSLGQQSETIAAANQIYVFERLRHHLAPLTLPAAELSERAVRHALLLAGLACVGAAARRLLGDRQPELTRLNLFAWGAVSLSVAGIFIELVFWNQPDVAASLLKYYWFRLADIAAPLALSLQTSLLITHGVVRQNTWGVVGLAAALVSTGWHMGLITVTRAQRPIAPADVKMRDYDAWVDVCRWCADHTPPDSMFLTPRLSHSFKWRAGRPEVVTQKDIPQDATGIVEWYERLMDVHYYVEDDDYKAYRSFGHQGTRRIEQLAAKYDVEYVISDKRRSLGLPVVYRNQEYVVYVVRDD